MSQFFVGVDLGQVRDPTAIAVVEAADVLRLRHLERIALKTAYADVVERVRQISRSKALDGRRQVVADATGVGRPVVEMLESAKLGGELLPVLATCGGKESRNGAYYHVPKRDLIVRVQTMLHAGKLHISGGLPDADALIRELTQMKVRQSESKRERFAAWNRSEHDDLVFAVALACWGAVKFQLAGSR